MNDVRNLLEWLKVNDFEYREFQRPIIAPGRVRTAPAAAPERPAEPRSWADGAEHAARAPQAAPTDARKLPLTEIFGRLARRI